MKVDLFKKRGIALTSKGIKFYYSYYLPDMAYGQFLVYSGLKPVYYIDALNDVYKELVDDAHVNNIDVETVLTRHFKKNKGLKLSFKEHCLLKFKYGKEKSEQLEIENLPLKLLDSRL